jgi:hypothetical protein
VSDNRRPGLIALVCGLAVLAARLPVALAHQDTWYPFEVHAGTIACALLDGVDLDLARLPIVAHIRGSVLFGLLLVPLYALGGASSLTLKLLPTLWHAGTVALLAGLLARYHSRRAAWCAGLLFLCAPPMLQKLSVLGLASHLESALPTLCTWGAWLAWTRDGATRGRALRFGAALGCSAFFHLQALLPSLLLLGLLVLRERARLWSAHGLWLSGAALLCGAPAFLFDGGAAVLLFSGVFTEDSGAAGDVGGFAKLARLAGGDLARALEFGGSAPPLDAWLGPLFVAGMALGALCGFAALRQHGRGTLFFPLHALLVAALYAASNLGVVEELGTGATNRHLAPMLVSLLAFAASGAVVARVGTATVLVVAALGAAGYPAVVRGSASARTPQRGECYEWFVRQLANPARGDAQSFAELLERIDRGDERLRPLRFAAPLTGLESRAQALLEAPAATDPGALDLAQRLEWSALGRHLSGRVDALAVAARDGHLDALTPRAREALMHGVGLALQPPRARLGLEAVHAFVATLQEHLAQFSATDARAMLEGYGAQIGQVFDPYNRNLARTVQLHAALQTPHAEAFGRGLGWGARQRYLRPPTSLPAGLALPSLLNARARAAFESAFTGRELPR